MTERMSSARVEATAAGGKVKVVYDGQIQPLSVEIDPAMLSEGGAAIGDALTVAMKAAHEDARNKMGQLMQQLQTELMEDIKVRARVGAALFFSACRACAVAARVSRVPARLSFLSPQRGGPGR